MNKIINKKQEEFINKYKKLNVKKNNKLEYEVIKYKVNIEDSNDKLKIIIFKGKTEKEFITKFNVNNEIEVEGIFKAFLNDFLIKGTLSELYNIGNRERLFSKYTRNENNIKETGKEQKKPIKIGTKFYPILDNTEYKVVKITKDKFKEISKLDLFPKNINGLPTILTKYSGNIYGNTHIIKINDYIRVDNDNFYRIYGPAFDLTYIINKNK